MQTQPLSSRQLSPLQRDVAGGDEQAQLDEARLTVQPTWLGIRRSAITEMLLFFLLIFVVDWIQGANRFWDVSLHPYFIIVILMAAQYGSEEGLLAAALSTLALMSGDLPQQGLETDWYAYTFELAKLPLLWFVTAVIIGETRERHIRERDALRESVRKSREREEYIAGAYKRLSGLKDTLETRLAGQLRSGLTVYQAAMMLEKLEPKDVILSIGDLVKQVTGARKFSLFLLEDGVLKHAILHNWGKNEQYSREIRESNPLHKAMLAERRLLCIVNEQDRDVLKQEGVLAAPLVNRDTGELIGMLKIEETGFLQLNMTTVETFRSLCDWIGKTYANARRYQQAKGESLVNPDLQTLSHRYLERQARFLALLARRAQFDVSQIVVRVADAGQYTRAQRTEAANVLSKAVQASLREIDQIFESRESEAEFAILLPYTPYENAHIVLDKIKTELRRLRKGMAFKPEFTHEVQTVHRAEVDAVKG